jgi:hypothetical protein
MYFEKYHNLVMSKAGFHRFRNRHMGGLKRMRPTNIDEAVKAISDVSAMVPSPNPLPLIFRAHFQLACILRYIGFNRACLCCT